jgi:hypothetical protein
MKKLSLAFLVFSLLISVSFSQTSTPVSPVNYQWFNASIGGGTNGLAGSVGYSVQFNNGLLRTRFLYTEEFNILSFSHQLWDVGVMYGFVTKPSKVVFSGTAGIALTGGRVKGEYIPNGGWFGGNYEGDPFVTVGIPVQIDAYLRLSRSFGLGISLYGNLNKNIPVAGVMLGLQIGRTWD